MKAVKTIQMACGQAYVASINKIGSELLEMGDVFLPNENTKGTRPYRFKDFGDVTDFNKRVITICTMVGCCFGCKFCSVRRSFKRLLTKDELVGQVDFCIQEGLKYGRLDDPNKSKEFHVLYTRMGEPMGNVDNVIASIYELASRYPHVKIGLSTCGLRQKVDKLLDHPEVAKHVMMQFSTHGTDEKTRSYMFDTETGRALMTIEEIAEFVPKFRKLNPRQISLNFILMQNQKYDFLSLRKYFNPEDVYIRLSPLNVTNNSNEQGMRGLLREEDVMYKMPFTSEVLKRIIDDLEKAGFVYAYAPAIDEEIKHKAACGQALETLKMDQLRTFDEQFSEIPELVKSYVKA